MKKWKGVFTALVTPFEESGALDLPAFRDLLKRQKAAGVAGVIPCGTTGESPTLSTEEKKTLIQASLEELKGSGIKVIPGTGGNDTRETVELSRWASSQGADGLLIVTPYYNKPSQVGLINHYTSIAENVSCDVLLYNVPGRTGVSLTAETVVRLAQHPRIRAIKEATGNLAFASEILDGLRAAGRKMDLLSGDDPTFLPFLSIGGDGIISVASNLIPDEMIRLQKYYEAGEWREAQNLHQRLYPLLRDLFVESNPVPIKYAMSLRKFCSAQLRAPLAPLSTASAQRVQAALQVL